MTTASPQRSARPAADADAPRGGAGLLRRRAASWLAHAAAALAVLGTALGLLAPHLGGDEPGWPGWSGFAAETVAAMWRQGGVLCAVLALGFAVLRRRRHALAVAACALVVLAPPAWRGLVAPGPRAQPRAATLRIATANLAEQNEHDPDMAAALRALDADVLVLTEYTASWQRRLAALETEFPHRFVGDPPPPGTPPLRAGVVVDGLRTAVWSRLPPVGPPTTILLDRVVPHLRVPLQWQGRTFAVHAVHPGKPWPRSLYARTFRQRCALVAVVRAETLPAIVAGDCNATPRSALVERLRDLGYTNVAEAVLGESPVTWNVQAAHLWPFRIAIDHVLCSREFEPLGFEPGRPTNSDHAAVVAVLRWRGG